MEAQLQLCLHVVRGCLRAAKTELCVPDPDPESCKALTHLLPGLDTKALLIPGLELQRAVEMSVDRETPTWKFCLLGMILPLSGLK